MNAQRPLQFERFLQCTDHTVSRETFTLFRERDRDLLVTIPQPPVQELAGYYESPDYISHTDARRSLIEKLYQLVTGYSLKRKLRLIGRINDGTGRLLDVGSGTGDFLKTCHDAGWTVIGVEPNDKARELAEAKVGQKNCYASLEHLPVPTVKKFDVITLWHVLEHVADLHQYIARMKSLLRKNGFLVIAVPNFNSRDANHYGGDWAAYDVPRHLWHFSRTSIEKIFADFKMQVVEEAPLPFDSFYVSLLSEKYRHGKTRYLPALYQGMISNWQARSTGEYSSLIYVLK